jgi:hypothetical protein
MSIEAVAEATPHRTIQLPPLGTPIPHLGGTFWALMRAKPDSGQADYALIVPHGPEFELLETSWGGYNKDEPAAACLWDGLANTLALTRSKHEHPAASFCWNLNERAPDLPSLYLPSLREAKALFAAGCDAFSDDGWYWTSTQYSRDYAFVQDFGNGSTDNYYKSWEGGRARAVRRSSIESLIP